MRTVLEVCLSKSTLLNCGFAIEAIGDRLMELGWTQKQIVDGQQAWLPLEDNARPEHDQDIPLATKTGKVVFKRFGGSVFDPALRLSTYSVRLDSVRLDMVGSSVLLDDLLDLFFSEQSPWITDLAAWLAQRDAEFSVWRSFLGLGGKDSLSWPAGLGETHFMPASVDPDRSTEIPDQVLRDIADFDLPGLPGVPRMPSMPLRPVPSTPPRPGEERAILEHLAAGGEVSPEQMVMTTGWPGGFKPGEVVKYQGNQVVVMPPHRKFESRPDGTVPIVFFQDARSVDPAELSRD